MVEGMILVTIIHFFSAMFAKPSSLLSPFRSHCFSNPYFSGVAGKSCARVDARNWYERNLEWHEERRKRRSRL